MKDNSASVVSPKTSFNFNLEALRGIAALLVVWHHLIYFKIDPAFSPTGALAFMAPGHLCVLLFFVLSGYVIGLTNPVPLTKATVAQYAKKRIVRIYPIYFICVLLALLVASNTYSSRTILSHFFLTQGITSPLIIEISPSWSLNYEVIFYVLFIPLSLFRINAALIALLVTVAGFLCAYLYPASGAALLASYLFGSTFWLTGLLLAKATSGKNKSYSYGAMLSVLFLFLCINQLDAFATLFYRLFTAITHKNLNTSVPFGPSITFRDLAFLPYCLLAIVLFIGSNFKYKEVIIFVLFIFPALTLAHFYKHQSFANPQVYVSCFFYAMSLLLYLLKDKIEIPAKVLIEKAVVTGSFSYGIYILHLPILWVFAHSAYFSGSLSTFWVRVVLFFLITIPTAYFLERKYQPFVKKLFSPDNAPLSKKLITQAKTAEQLIGK